MVTWKTTTDYQPAAMDLAGFVAAHGLALPMAADTPGAPVLVIERAAWDAVWAHARSADVEVGGLLVGEVFHDAGDGRAVTVIRGAIPALGGASSAVSFTFTPAAWDHLTTERDRSWPELITVGWFHTHPNLGVFYSSVDRATQSAHFNRPWNVGIVVDPRAASDSVALFVGAQSDRLPADVLIVLPDAEAIVLEPTVAPEPRPAAQLPAAQPSAAPSGPWRWSRPSLPARITWTDRRSRVSAAAAVGATAGVVAVLISEWLRSQRREG